MVGIAIFHFLLLYLLRLVFHLFSDPSQICNIEFKVYDFFFFRTGLNVVCVVSRCVPGTRIVMVTTTGI